MCDAALNSNVWSSTGANTAGVSEGPGWVETGVGRITGNNGYQCVELVQRYFYFRFGVCPWDWADAKDMCNATLPSTVVITTTPVHGDLIVITPGCDGAGLATGHVAVVDTLNGATVSVVQQNAGTNGYGTFHVSLRNLLPSRGRQPSGPMSGDAVPGLTSCLPRPVKVSWPPLSYWRHLGCSPARDRKRARG